MANLSDEKLVRLALKGNDSAFAQIVERYERQVYHTVYAVLGSKEDAEDAAQETFLKIWKTLPQFRGDCRLSTWIFRVAKNTALDYASYRGRRAAVSLSYTDPDDGELAETEIEDTGVYLPPEDELMKKETVEAVRKALEALAPEHRVILVLREFDGLSYQDISERLDLDIGTVKSRISRAKNHLKKILSEGNFFDSDPSNCSEKKCESFSSERSDPSDLQ